MNNETNKNIVSCIAYLKSHGYEVFKKNDSNIGKWVAYKRQGMDCILHGKIIGGNASCYTIRKKNHGKDYAGIDKIIAFFDDKTECYNMR